MARNTHISVLQFDERTIARLRVRRSPKAIEVVSYDMEHGSWPAADNSLAEAVKAFVKTHQVAADDVCTVLPRHDMTARILTMPSHNSAEIESMVQLSAEEYVPYPAHELVIDQSIVQKGGDGTSKVLAIFAHRDIVESHVDILRACGIDPLHIYVSTACLASAAQQAIRGNTRFALVNLGSGGVEILVMQNGRLLYSRGVALSVDWSRLTGPETSEAEELAAEVRSSLSAYRRDSEDGEVVEQVFVCSDYSSADAAVQALAGLTSYECAPAPIGPLFAHAAPSLGLPFIAAGAALAAQDRASLVVSLVPQSLLTARRTGEMRRTLYMAGGLAAAVLFSACAVFGQAYYQRASYSKELQARINAVQPIAEGVESKRLQLVRLQQHLDRRGSALELLAKLSELIPRTGVTITRFSFVHNDTLTIQGRAESPGLAYDLTDALRAAGREEVPQFARAKSGASKEEMEQNQPVYQFEIIIPLAEDDDAPAEANE